MRHPLVGLMIKIRRIILTLPIESFILSKHRDEMKYLIALIICSLSVLTVSAQQETVEKPEPVATVKPAYPASAFAHRVNGHVIVSYDVNNEGDVVNARVVSAEPAGIFDEEALRAIRKWKFTPHKPWQGLTKDFSFMINMKSSVE